jgi:cellulose synthase/poly-beta-1,6-N-acetylglucosamine synthase-like glycosyltransferase/peptidoglycan/xylan/chitin deacetylase (PgdA/CDA1 family)
MEFSRELHAVLHPAGYLTSIDVNPFDRQMDFKGLAVYYDFIFLMAYDEHYPESSPGSISSMPFVEKALDHALKNMPSEKSVLCVGGYGYDWPGEGQGIDISYHDLISLANEYGVPVEFNEENLDLSLHFTDDMNIRHEVHGNDAAGIFNLLRTSADYGTAGVALWYLGAEDSRIWTFYSKNLNADSLERHPYDPKLLESLHSIYSVDYEGKGEILQILSEPRPGKSKIEFDKRDKIITKEDYLSLPASYVVKRYGAVDHKQVALTFDDGPDADFTPSILDILKEKHVPATFFVTGINSENNLPLIRRIYREGHEIGNHTFTHPNLENISKERERMELRSTRLLIESVIGHSTILFRPPYNTDAEPRNMFQIEPVAVAGEEGFICVAASIDPNDWEEGVTADTILARAKEQEQMGNIILLHDAGGERSQTVKALPYIIDYYKSHGYRFTTVSALMGKTRDQVMPAVSGRQKLPESLDLIPFIITFLWENFLHGFFVIAILLTILKLIVLAVMSFLQHRRESKKTGIAGSYQPKVSIIVPAFNEHLNAVNTITALLQSDYPDYEILFVDDGSTDHTLLNVRSVFDGNPMVKVLTKPNGGKADALNLGTKEASGEILVCIDADTLLAKDAVSKMIPFFEDPAVAGVAGNVRVGNSLNLLTRVQSLEYTTSQNFDRRAFDYVNAVIVIPGAIGAFRKMAVEAIGGFAMDTLAEDCDLTLRLLRAGYIVRNGNEALAFTEAPETLRMFLKQRFRWSFGMMQSFWKHRDLLFNVRKTNLGWILLPNLLIFNFIIPLFSPWVDIMFVAGLFTRHATEYLFIYFLYYIVDCGVSVFAYHYDHMTFSPRKALLLFVQRFIYRQLLFYVLFKAYLKAIRGELANWGVLKRTGHATS